MFGATFDFLFYDITSTYFEGSADGNPQAKRGYSRDSRPDCPQVCIGLVATIEGLPLAFEVFDRNRPDVTTTQEMVDIMETKYGLPIIAQCKICNCGRWASEAGEVLRRDFMS
jgi:transposase